MDSLDTGSVTRDERASTWRHRSIALVALDLRALALWRVALASLLIIDLAWRAFDLDLFYTDSGLLPRSSLGWLDLPHPNLSLHALSGAPWWQWLLGALALGCALGLLVGWRTRAMALASWILLVSLHARNPLVLYRGDVVLRVMLLWSLFVPLGARYSLDARRRSAHSEDAGPPTATIASMGSVALLVQLVCIYWFSVLHKSDAVWWSEGHAVYYALQLDSYVTAAGAWLGQYPQWSPALTWTTLGIELAAPLLLLSPWRTRRCRLAAIALAFSLHLGFMLTMRLDLFGPVMLAIWLPWLPMPRSDSLRARSSRPGALLPASRWVVAAMLSAMVVWNIYQVRDEEPPAALESWMRPIGLVQSWSMFSPHPARDDGWLVVAAFSMEQPEGTDLLRARRPVTSARPGDLGDSSLRWRSLSTMLLRDAGRRHREDLLAWACRSAGPSAEMVALIFEEEYTMPPGQDPRRSNRTLAMRECSRDPAR